MASYQYEQLNDESFQQLSQSLLLKEFQGLQCFPVGQPDGGRDATYSLFEPALGTTRFILFQVKFARRELSPNEARSWLERTLKKELPKVRLQIEKGAEQFILVTNVSGTGHSETGSMDKLQNLLRKHIPIPAQAWWREDLDRRLDNSWDLKFAYPVLFTGTDLLRLIVEVSPSEGRERRRIALKTFLAHQYHSDRKVKFKQAELESDIFKLFTDVPMVPQYSASKRPGTLDRLAAAFSRAAKSETGKIDSLWMNHLLENTFRGENSFSGSFWSRYGGQYRGHHGGYYPSDEPWLGAASLLLDADFQQAEPLVLLEGAPGQGKSTIAQYICQVHRMRLLNLTEGGPGERVHVNSSLRIPFKVELRDFATWLSGVNPFGTANGADSSGDFPKSLEDFLSALVHHGSGGSTFDVSDLQAILTSLPALVVLDGLDEVAEIRQRQRVIKEISSAVVRLNSIAESIQFVVTSRPTPFINSTDQLSDSFATYSLGSLTKPLIIEYAGRWLESRLIDSAEARDVHKILETKLDEPHLRDLARNPMQLAILLSLIHRRGISLPDKRTALYDNYIEIFFDREAEKATVVKENRELLIRIHRYLAWKLQAGAESEYDSTSSFQRSGTLLSGSISEEDLKILLREFLKKDQSDPDLVERLFSGMVERVVAIVSRVQGTYEFDVQTLREYFAARHLYQTAPYSPPGGEQKGTISHRWNALSRNFYWLNVARFYAGCYSEGQISSLIDDLGALCNDDVFRWTSHPHLLTATLLGDWVFSQRPPAIRSAVQLLLDPRGLRMLLAGIGTSSSQFEEVIVRDPAGRDLLTSACKEFAGPDRPMEQVVEVLQGVLRPNLSPVELYDWWIGELQNADETEAKHWCILGEYLQCWSTVELETVLDLLERNEVPSSSVISGLLYANRMDVLESSEELFGAAVEAVLAGKRFGLSRGSSFLQKLAWSLVPPVAVWHNPRASITGQRSPFEFLGRFHGFEEKITIPSYCIAERASILVEAFESAAKQSFADWFTSIEPWDCIVRQGINEFGERKVFVDFANLAAGIRSKKEKCLDSKDLFDCAQPMVRRARYARLRAGSRKWWSKQLQAANNADKAWMALLLFATWAGAKTIEALAESFDRLMASLPTAEWESLHSSLRWANEINSRRDWIKPRDISVSSLPPKLSARTACLLAQRCNPGTSEEFYERYLSDYKGDDFIVVTFCARVQVSRALREDTKWPQAIEGLRSSYSLGAPTGRPSLQQLGLGPGFSKDLNRVSLPDAVARKIVSNPIEYPSDLVRIAEARCRQHDAARIVPVGQVADEDGWFLD